MALPNVDRLRELLDYDPETGLFTRRIYVPGHRAGSRAGSLSDHGYITCRVDRRNYRAHRLAWLHFYGAPPPGDIDHINRCRTDNRIQNLRLADCSENGWNRGAQRNNSAGIKGAHKSRHRYVSQIRARGRWIYLGCFDTAEEAGAAYAAAVAQYHGEFARAA